MRKSCIVDKCLHLYLGAYLLFLLYPRCWSDKKGKKGFQKETGNRPIAGQSYALLKSWTTVYATQLLNTLFYRPSFV